MIYLVTLLQSWVCKINPGNVTGLMMRHTKYVLCHCKGLLRKVTECLTDNLEMLQKRFVSEFLET